MSALRNLVDKIKPTFTKGGKLGFLESTFDAFETFLFVPNTTTQKGAHIRDCNDMKRTMIMVVVALMPALLFGFYNTGYLHFLSQGVQPEFWASLWFGFLKVLPIIVVSYVVGLGIEFAFAQARGHEVNEGFLVTGLLIPMIMPVDIPLWMVALATAFSVIFGKEVFGGTGMNVFNPALLARAFAFFAYTPSMSGATVWIAGMTEDMKNVAANIPGYVPQVVDGFSGATALENLSTTGQMGYSAMDAFLGFIPGCIGETSTLAILLGAALVHGRRFVAHDGFGIRRRAGDGLFLPGDRCDDLSGMVPPDHRRFRIRCRLHGHRPRDLGPDQYGQVHRGAADRCAGSADDRYSKYLCTYKRQQRGSEGHKSCNNQH